MKKNSLLILLCLIAQVIMAAPRSAEQAAALAAGFMNENVVGPNKTPASQATLQLVHQCTKLESEEPAFYVFNKTDKGGFVIVSADDRTEDILGYANEGSIGQTINPNLAFWLRCLQRAISATNDSVAPHKTPQATVTAIGPLLVNKDGKEITWDQTAPYYNLCPKDANGSLCLTGCVATAAAQIMYKWRYPEQGIGTHSYTWENSKGTKKTLSVDYESTTYDWDNMLPAYYRKSATDAQKMAVATLMYHAGVACNMQYSSEGSGSYTDDMAQGLIDHFGYTVDKFVTTYSSYRYPTDFKPTEFKVTVAKLTEYFNQDLEEKRPILMGGVDQRGGGHEFVCDGRDTKGYFHINWGWEGQGNGYFSLSSLSVDGYNFSSNIDAVIGLRPEKTDTVHVTSIAIKPQTATLKINERVTIVPSLQPQNATVKTVFWSSSDQNVAQVSTSGTIRAIGQGTATITATTKDGGFEATCAITVTNEVAPSYVFELLTDASTLKEGDDIIMEATYNSVHYCATNTIETTKTTAYTNCEQVQIVDNTITLPDNSDIAVYTLGLQNGAWTLTNAYGQKLGAVALKKLCYDEGTITWTIELNSAKYATIANTTTSYGHFYYHNNNNLPRFNVYMSPTSSSMHLPQIYVRRNSKPVSVVNVTGVELGQTSAQMLIGQEIFLYYSIKPADATNQAVMWTSSNENVVKVDPSQISLEDDKTCAITALAEGEATVTIKTLDGGFTASCVVTVTEQPVVPTDTTFVSSSEAQRIGLALPAGSQTKDFYGVKGFVTVQNTVEYQGFWLDDEPLTGKETFQGFQCTMPANHLYLKVGEHVCLYGYIMNYNNEKAQIKNGFVEVIDTPSSLSPYPSTPLLPVTKIIENGHILFLRGSSKFNVLGVAL